MNKKALFLLLIIGVPILVYVILGRGKNVYKELPIYGNPVGLTPEGDTIYHTVPEFSMLDQDSNVFHSSELQGQVYVVDFFFTRCGGICPALTRNLAAQHEKLKVYKDIKVLSISIDPEHDRPHVLKRFAQKYNADHPYWRFLAGNDSLVDFLISEKGFLQQRPVRDEEDVAQTAHTGMLILVDEKGRIRGNYLGTEAAETKKMVEDLHLLVVQRSQRQDPTVKKYLKP